VPDANEIERWIELAAAGDEVAFEQLRLHLDPYLRSIAAEILSDAELEGRAIERAWQRIRDGLRGIESRSDSFRSFARSIAEDEAVQPLIVQAKEQDGRRDEEAFSALYRRYSKRVQGIVRARLPFQDLAALEEASQDVWVRIADSLSNYRPGQSTFMAFIRGVATFALIDYLRAHPPQTGELTEARISHAPPPPSTVLGELLGMALAAGAPHQAVVFGFNQLLEYTPAQIVETLSGISLRDLASRLEHEYISKLPSQRAVRQAFEPLHKGLSGLEGNLALQQHFSDDPAQNIAAWCWSLKRRLLSEVLSQEEEFLREVFGTEKAACPRPHESLTFGFTRVLRWSAADFWRAKYAARLETLLNEFETGYLQWSRLTARAVARCLLDFRLGLERRIHSLRHDGDSAPVWRVPVLSQVGDTEPRHYVEPGADPIEQVAGWRERAHAWVIQTLRENQKWFVYAYVCGYVPGARQRYGCARAAA
jgi:DNA-directed RNA polymerase specialized sigma24 family protein